MIPVLTRYLREEASRIAPKLSMPANRVLVLLRHAASTGELPSKRDGDHFVVDPADVDRWVHHRLETPRKKRGPGTPRHHFK